MFQISITKSSNLAMLFQWVHWYSDTYMEKLLLIQNFNLASYPYTYGCDKSDSQPSCHSSHSHTPSFHHMVLPFCLNYWSNILLFTLKILSMCSTTCGSPLLKKEQFYILFRNNIVVFTYIFYGALWESFCVLFICSQFSGCIFTSKL